MKFSFSSEISSSFCKYPQRLNGIMALYKFCIIIIIIIITFSSYFQLKKVFFIFISLS